MENDVVREGGVGIHFNKKKEKVVGGGGVEKSDGVRNGKEWGEGVKFKGWGGK